MFSRIDHIGVAVEEIDAALELYRDSFELEVAHREVVEEQGVEAVLLDVGENHVELIAPLAPDTPVGKFLAKQGPGLHHVAYQVADIDATLEELKAGGHATDRRAAAHRHPRLARRVRAPPRNRGRANRDRRAGGGSGSALMADSRRVTIGFQGGQVLAMRLTDAVLKKLNEELGSGGWHEFESEDGPVRVDLGQVVYVSAEGDDSRVGFG